MLCGMLLEAPSFSRKEFQALLDLNEGSHPCRKWIDLKV
jgi:hypothetical protein